MSELKPCSVCGPTCWGHHEDPRLIAPETLEAFGKRIAAAVRTQFIGTGDDAMIAGIRESHMVFGRACAMEAINEAMHSAAIRQLSSSPDEGVAS